MFLFYRGESARKDSIAGPEVLAQQQAVMAAVEAEIKQKNSVENPSAFSTVSIIVYICCTYTRPNTYFKSNIAYSLHN